MLFIIVGIAFIGIVILSVIPFQGYGVAERTFCVAFNENENCQDISKNGTYELTIYSRRINNFLLILLLFICMVCLIVALFQNGYIFVFTNNPVVGTLYAIPVLILAAILFRQLMIFTSKIYIYPNNIIIKNIFIKRIFLYNNINKLELYNYVTVNYKLGYKDGLRSYSKRAYIIFLKNGKNIKIWAHHYKELSKIENCFHSKNPCIKQVKKKNKINENTIKPLTFFISLK